jgi:malate permease and related proteins
MDSSAVLNATLPVYLMMLVGALVRKFGWFPQEAEKGTTNIIVRLLTPCLAFERIVGNSALNDPREVLLAATLGYVLIAATILFCYAITPLLGLKKGAGARTFGLCTGLQNYGFVAIPVLEALFGKQLVGVLFTFSLGIELALWTVGVGLLTGFSKAPWRHAFTPPVFGIIGSLILHYAGVGPHVPEVVHIFASQLGGCAIPLSLLLIGAVLMDCIGAERMNWPVAIVAPILRLLLLPFVLILAARWIPMSNDLKKVFCVQAVMPSAVFTVVIARHYGGHAPTAALIVVSTTLGSLLTVAWMIRAALHFAGV